MSFGADALTLIAVTVLTSMNDDDLKGIGMISSASDYVVRLSGRQRVWPRRRSLFRLRSGSAKNHCVASFQLLTPGIRPAGSDTVDQRKVMTPLEEQQARVDYMVIERPITQVADLSAALAAIFQELHVGAAYGE